MAASRRAGGRWVFRARAFGDDLRAARELRELSGEDVALELGVTANTIYRVELADVAGGIRVVTIAELASFYALDLPSYFERRFD